MNPSGKPVKWRCIVCGEVFVGIAPPKVCPACGVGPEMFEILEESDSVFYSEEKLKILIIGNGAAGISAAEAVRKRNKCAEIEIITAENETAYYRPSLSDYLVDTVSAENLLIRPLRWYKENSINVVYGKTVSKIDSNNKKIILDDDSEKGFDKLIIANGSRCAIPPIQNINKEGVFSLRSKDDAEKIKKYAKHSKKVVVIGGGVLGLEAAWGLSKLGLEVEIVEAETRILPRQLDSDGSKMFETILEREGIVLNKNHFVKVVWGESVASGVELDNGKMIGADMILVSAGIKPNKEISEGTEIKVNRGIIVNNKMETSVKDIYACGDIAEYDGIASGLWSPALEQGKAAGANAVGDLISYKHSVHPVTFSGISTEIFSIGDLGTGVDKYEITTYLDEKASIYKKLYFKDGISVGGILIGDTSKASVLLKGVRNRHSIEQLIKALI